MNEIAKRPGDPDLDRWPLTRFKRYARNSRTHDADQVEAIAASLLEFGWGPPILVRGETGEIAAGHGRLAAAELLVERGHEEFREAPVLIKHGWTDAQFRAYVIADNRLAEKAGWDEAMLKTELAELREIEGFHIDLTGFDDGYLDGLGKEVSKAARQSLADRFGLPPFSVLNAREGWWQDRKRAWLALGIMSELGRGQGVDEPNAAPGGGLMPAADYSQNRARGDGKGRPINPAGSQRLPAGQGGLSDRMAAGEGTGRGHEAIPGGAGRNSVYRDKGARARGHAPRSVNGNLTLATTGRHNSDEGTLKILAAGRKATAGRALGQDMLKGEGEFGPAWSEASGGIERSKARATNTQEWVRQKIDEGDIEGGMASGQTGTSIFDPVLCELAYRWFCPPHGLILDPFAGGSVRGLVASRLGRSYIGVELRRQQVAANRLQLDIAGDGPIPIWLPGDSRQFPEIVRHEVSGEIRGDMIFSCPPYADLEVYSDDPADLSTLPYPKFREAHAAIIAGACSLLRDDAFAIWVVGEARGPDGNYYGLVPDTVAAFQAAGLGLYNEAILITAAGSLPIRAAKQFESTRKLGKTHQNVLVFLKGSAKKATAKIGAVEFGAIEGEDEFEVVGQ